MSNLVVTSPQRPYTFLDKFKAVSNGDVYAGIVDKTDLENPANQIQVYVVGEDGSETPVSQPLKINSGGLLVYNGQPAKFVVKQNYSMLVKQRGKQVMYEPNMAFVDPEAIASIVSDGLSMVSSGNIWPEAGAPLLPMGNQSSFVPSGYSVLGVDTGNTPEDGYLVQRSTGFESSDRTITNITKLNNQTYVVTTTTGVFNFTTKEIAQFRDNADPRGWGADTTGSTDSIEALDAAKAFADATLQQVFLAPNTTYGISRTWYTSNKTGTGVKGSGEDSSRIKVLTGFTDPEAVVAGNRNTTTNTRNVHINSFGIDVDEADSTIPFAHYGLRDGSTILNLYLTNFSATAYKSNISGNGTGQATGLMNQGLYINSVHAISSKDIKGNVWSINGMFESTIESCKALGFGSAQNEAQGFAIGISTECRGVRMVGCSAGNFKNLDPSKQSRGIVYGEWARNCWDVNTTFENIQGGCTRFNGGNASGIVQPINCRTESPRIFNDGQTGTQTPVAEFFDCQACYFGVLNYFATNKVWARFRNPVVGQLNNQFECNGGANPSTMVGNQIIFDSMSHASNRVSGWSSSSNSRIDYVLTNISNGGVSGKYETNGFTQTHDEFWSTLQTGPGAANKMRIRKNDGTTMFTVDGINTRIEMDINNLKITGLPSMTNTSNLVFAKDNGDGTSTLMLKQ